MNRRRRGALCLWGIVCLAFALRVAYLWGAQASPYFEQPSMDPLYHLEWARAFANGHSYQPGPFFRAPLYPWFLGGAMRLLGENLLLLRLLQAALGALTTVIGFALARRFFERRVALLCAFLIATNWVLIYFDGEFLIPTLAIPLNLAALLQSARLSHKPTAKSALGAGLLWGLAALARPNVLLFLPPLALWLMWSLRSAQGRGWRTVLALTAGCLLPILPITGYNYSVGGDTVLISSQAGVNLWIGNNPQADGSSAIVPGTRPGWWEGFEDSIRLAEEAAGRELQASEVSAHYTRRALYFMGATPAAALRLMVWKLRLFWTDWELGNNADVHFFATEFTPWMGWLPSRFGWLVPLSLLGLVFSRRRLNELFVLWGFLAVYTISVVLFFVCARFRAPILPLLCVFASVGTWGLVDLARAKRFGPLALSLASLALVALGVGRLPAGLDTSRSMGLWALGIERLQAEDAPAAKSLFLAALEENPRNWFALRDLGAAHRASGELLEASERLHSVLRLRPEEYAVRSSLVDLLLARGDLAGAHSLARRGIKISPAFAVSYDALARVHVARKRWSEAIDVLRAGLRQEPEDVTCNLRLGGLLLQVGQACAALEPLARAAACAALPPGSAPSLQQALAQARAGCAGE